MSPDDFWAASWFPAMLKSLSTVELYTLGLLLNGPLEKVLEVVLLGRSGLNVIVPLGGFFGLAPRISDSGTSGVLRIVMPTVFVLLEPASRLPTLAEELSSGLLNDLTCTENGKTDSLGLQ